MDKSITEVMRRAFEPRGTAQIVTLQLYDTFFNHDFVIQCVEELERMPMRVSSGQPMTNLERLASILLCDSAFIDLDEYKKEQEKVNEA